MTTQITLFVQQFHGEQPASTDRLIYSGAEAAELFSAEECASLLAGEVIERTDKFGRSRFVCAEALARAAFLNA